WGHESARRHAWRGLALYGVDGSTLRVADSQDNAAHFGRARNQRSDGGYPQVRVTALMALRSHLLAAVSFGPYTTGEITLARELWPEVPDDSLTIVDRNFLSGGILVPLVRGGRNRHWLIRAKAEEPKIIEALGNDEFIVEIATSSRLREADPS